MPPSGGYATLDDVHQTGEEGAATSPKSNGHGPHSPTSPSRHGLSRHGSSHSFSQDDLAHFNPLDELAGFFEAQLEKRNPQAAAKAKEFRKRVGNLTKKAEIHRDKKKAAEIETIEYLPQDSKVYRDWLRGQQLELYWDRWAMMFLVGLAVGICAYCLHEFFHGLAEWKTDIMREIIKNNVGLAWLFNVAFSCVLVAGSAASVLWISPAAAGSGVPEVMAYLNGCLLPRMFEWRTAAIKFLSCALCVGAGLPVGPEGPMIFLGAALGGLVSQGQTSTKLIRNEQFRAQVDRVLTGMGKWAWPFKRFRNRGDQRDFMTAGCAAGVAAAFGSPVGGLLFCFEEMASFWKITLGWQIFFACMTAVFARGFAESLADGETLGLFNNSIAYETNKIVKTHVLSMVVAMFVGAANGFMGAIFTRINLKWTTLRAQYVGGVRWKRLVEPIVYMFIIASLSMVLPYAFPCRESGCVTTSAGVVVCNNATMSDAGLQLVIEASTETFTCREDFSLKDAFLGTAVGVNTEREADAEVEIGTRRFNELATLMHVPGSSAVKHLISRGTPREFGYGSILTFFIVYYLGAAITAGSCISSGLFVPMLVMGACVGRFCGLVAYDIAGYAGFTQEDLATEMWAWIDPGVFAMVGAGAFMAGVSRLTLSLAVIVMEMTNEVHFLLPILLGIMVAKWVSDAMEHALYHSLLEFKNVPFLPSDPPGGQALEILPVSAIMCHGPVKVVHEKESLLAATELLRSTKFHAYPVVRNSERGEELVGIITRDHLTVVLMHAALQQSRNTQRGTMTYEQLDGKVDIKGIERKADEEADRELKIIENGDSEAETSIDLTPYVNRSEIAVHKDFSAMRTYLLFRTMGLRHMPIVNEHNNVVGIVTRKELLSEALVERLHDEGIHVGGGH